MTTVFDFSARMPDGREVPLSNYRGKVLLVVNTASKCGLTPQLAGLAELHRDLGPRGFSVLAFPCNQFGRQEPREGGDLGAFCETNFGTTFPVFDKVAVNGANAHPLFVFLKKERPGLLGLGLVKWNFTKFLIDRDGHPVARFAPMAQPSKLRAPIERLLDAPAAASIAA